MAASHSLSPIVSLSGVSSGFVPTRASEQSESEFGDDTRVFDRRVHVLLRQEELLPVRASRSFSSVVFERHSRKVSTVEEPSGVSDDFLEHNGVHTSSSDVDSGGDSVSAQSVLGSGLDILVEKIGRETKNVGELMSESTEKEEFLQSAFLQKGQVQDVGTSHRTVVSGREMAGSGSGEIVS